MWNVSVASKTGIGIYFFLWLDSFSLGERPSVYLPMLLLLFLPMHENKQIFADRSFAELPKLALWAKSTDGGATATPTTLKIHIKFAAKQKQ